MNIKKLTPEMIVFIKNAIKIGIPISVIAKVCEISYALVSKHTKDVRKTHIKEFTGNTLKLEMLKLYAWSIADSENFNSAIGYHEKLSKALYKYLNLDSWKHYLNGLVLAVNNFQTWSFNSSVPEGYRNLFNAMYENQNEKLTGKMVLHRCITEMYDNGTFPDEEFIFSPEKALLQYVHNILEIEKLKNTFLVTDEFVHTVDAFVLSFSNDRMRTIIKTYYGICGENKLVPKLIASNLFCPESSVESLRRKFLVYLHKHLKAFNFFVESNQVCKSIFEKQRNINELKNTVREQEQKIFKNKEQLHLLCSVIIKKVDFSLIDVHENKMLRDLGYDLSEKESIAKAIESDQAAATVFNLSAEQLKFLKTPLIDMDLSVRVYNCLKEFSIYFKNDASMHINYSWQILNHSIEDLLKSRNFGKKSLIELEEYFRDKKIPFKKLSPQLIEYFIEYNIC